MGKYKKDKIRGWGMDHYLLAIDQGTTSNRAIVFNQKGALIATSQQAITQSFPNDGWVEHSPEEIWQTTLNVCREAIRKAKIEAKELVSIGITNQRETTIVWDEQTGKAVYPAIVWQDRRTADYCAKLKKQGYESLISERTGLLIDPYFSATKLRWILDNVPNVREKAEKGMLKFGTVDSFLLWHLTGGQSHYTDASNAARTMLFNIHTQQWDKELLALFNIPEVMLPDVKDCAAEFGVTDMLAFGANVPIRGMAGDQQAALFGQACFEEGMIKSTYGTGCFMIKNMGETAVQSKNRLLTTVGYRLNGEVTYALEGSIFVAGAAIQWLRDGVKLIEHVAQTESMAEEIGDSGGVYLVPAFTGLGAPYWDPKARGAIFGLTRDTGIKEIVTAGLQSVCYQTYDLIDAMQQDGGATIGTLRVDGGMAVNNWVMQFLADILDVTVERPSINETTALGVAWLAGLQSGLYQGLDEIAHFWCLQRRFESNMSVQKRKKLYAGWLDAVNRVRCE